MNLDERKALEHLILLFLGIKDQSMTLTHLQKEIFLIWNFDPRVKDFVNFIKHAFGPYSPEISAIVEDPIFLIGCWSYNKSSDLRGGRIELTSKGKEKYLTDLEKIERNEQMKLFLSAIKMVRELYDKLSVNELLLLVYVTYPKYKEFSDVWIKINNQRKYLSKSILSKGLIDEKKYIEISEDVNCR